MKSRWLTLLKILLPIAVIAWLLSRLEPGELQQLASQPKHWGLLLAAFCMAFSAVSLSFLRWWLLVRALELPFRVRDAFRLGFMGFLMNFVSVGAVGGDLFKAIFIAREQPRRRGEAVASVLVDRVVGLYALLLVASAGILWGGHVQQHAAVRVLCRTTLAGAAIGAVGILALMLPTLTNQWISGLAERLPIGGRMLAKVISAVRLYKSRPDILAMIAVVSVGTHVLLACSIYLIACGLFSTVPPLSEHLVMVPLAMIANSLPLTPGGLGALEVALDELYRLVPVAPHAVSGVLVALVYRITTLAIAGVGAVFYVTNRQEIETLIDEAQEK